MYTNVRTCSCSVTGIFTKYILYSSIGHILPRNRLLKHVTEGKTEGTRRQGRRRKQENRRHWIERESIRSHSAENSFERNYEPVAGQTTLGTSIRRTYSNKNKIETFLFFATKYNHRRWHLTDSVWCNTSNRQRSQWPWGPRPGSAAIRLLGLWVGIPLGAWMSHVSIVRCQVEVSASGRSLVQRIPTKCDSLWSWSLENEEALGHYGMLRHGKKNYNL